MGNWEWGIVQRMSFIGNGKWGIGNCELPITIPPSLPFLRAICWQTRDVRQFSLPQMLSRYERGWLYRGVLGEPTSEELQFIQQLCDRYGSWLMSEFQAPLHKTIFTILSELKDETFAECQAYFCGETLIALSHSQFRLSKDIDFLVCAGSTYGSLRSRLDDDGYCALFKNTTQVGLPQSLQTNQFGVRFPVVVNDVTVKVEIVVEARIDLGEPETLSWCPVPCLNRTDQIAEKLLANSDRALDTSVRSRDLYRSRHVASRCTFPR
ncbi:MAG: nucleotidyl transferase AbiEii/AbiGii toxin family protein [Cyanobacteriota bacterium]|nr:nucleotidyl transferase AbiEii/AbiGii toxin family protein [Cyanobacteriota bacterium]